ncbi:MAG: DUF192 domain-containing protein [Planctomycetes bacterium]|nr:DUF192 domain-containing protein [Planctomycetota bacterium]
MTMNARHQLIDVETGEVIIAKLQVADTFWRRFRGLQFRRPLAPDEGLLLTPCRSIHTHWMRFSIDAAMLDRQGVVLNVVNRVRPWRWVRGSAETHSILEAASGQLAPQLVGSRVRIAEPAIAPGAPAASGSVFRSLERPGLVRRLGGRGANDRNNNQPFDERKAMVRVCQAAAPHRSHHIS